ncbi:hypothetical protein SUGI_0190090 [Cryptomeria japonica]|nr:hypothetical protein SUGI_0190090 [Cryptomeria japonica]
MFAMERYEKAKQRNAVMETRNISNTMGTVSNFAHTNDGIDSCNMGKEWERCNNERLHVELWPNVNGDEMGCEGQNFGWKKMDREELIFSIVCTKMKLKSG